MVTGAVICDAGITAILTSIISNRDQQEGTNNRRIQCCKRFMKTNMIDESLQERVLNFYNYNDVQLENINESEILSNFPVNLRNEVLDFFCLKPLKESALMNKSTEGALRSLVQMMNPYLAIPGEQLSVPYEPCEMIFILRSGFMKSIDNVGYETALPLGSVIGHAETTAQTQKYGPPEKILHISLTSAQGLKGKVGHPYVIFKVGSYKCRSTVKKTKDWSENIFMKLPKNVQQSLEITVKSWQKGQIHSTIGSINVSFDENMSDEQHLMVMDPQGKNVGSLNLALYWRELTPNEILYNNELTTIAKGYCHLYCVEAFKYEQLRQYFDSSSKIQLEQRLTGPFLEHQHHELERRLSDKERIKSYWRRPSRPSYVSPPPMINKSLSIDHKPVIQRKHEIKDDFSGDKEDDDNLDIVNNTRGILKQASDILSRRRIVNSNAPSIHPETDEEAGIQHNDGKNRRSWMSSNAVKTGTLSSQGKLNIDRSEEDLSLILEELSERDESWDVLVDLHDENDKSISSRRKGTFFVEWVTPINNK